MKTSRSLRPRHFLALSWMLSTGFGLATHASAEEPKKPTTASAPERVVITAEPPDAPLPVPPSVVERSLTGADGAGFKRAPGEARFVTGSFTKQKIEVHGNATNGSSALQVFTQGDLRKGGFLTGTQVASYSDIMEQRPASVAPQPARTIRVRTVRTLDLRTVEPARRLQVATQLLGPERGRKLVADTNRWEATRNKRLAAQRTAPSPTGE